MSQENQSSDMATSSKMSSTTFENGQKFEFESLKIQKITIPIMECDDPISFSPIEASDLQLSLSDEQQSDRQLPTPTSIIINGVEYGEISKKGSSTLSNMHMDRRGTFDSSAQYDSGTTHVQNDHSRDLPSSSNVKQYFPKARKSKDNKPIDYKRKEKPIIIVNENDQSENLNLRNQLDISNENESEENYAHVRQGKPNETASTSIYYCEHFKATIASSSRQHSDLESLQDDIQLSTPHPSMANEVSSQTTENVSLNQVNEPMRNARSKEEQVDNVTHANLHAEVEHAKIQEPVIKKSTLTKKVVVVYEPQNKDMVHADMQNKMRSFNTGMQKKISPYGVASFPHYMKMSHSQSQVVGVEQFPKNITTIDGDHRNKSGDVHSLFRINNEKKSSKLNKKGKSSKVALERICASEPLKFQEIIIPIVECADPDSSLPMETSNVEYSMSDSQENEEASIITPYEYGAGEPSNSKAMSVLSKSHRRPVFGFTIQQVKEYKDSRKIPTKKSLAKEKMMKNQIEKNMGMHRLKHRKIEEKSIKPNDGQRLKKAQRPTKRRIIRANKLDIVYGSQRKDVFLLSDGKHVQKPTATFGVPNTFADGGATSYPRYTAKRQSQPRVVRVRALPIDNDLIDANKHRETINDGASLSRITNDEMTICLKSYKIKERPRPLICKNTCAKLIADAQIVEIDDDDDEQFEDDNDPLTFDPLVEVIMMNELTERFIKKGLKFNLKNLQSIHSLACTALAQAPVQCADFGPFLKKYNIDKHCVYRNDEINVATSTIVNTLDFQSDDQKKQQLIDKALIDQLKTQFVLKGRKFTIEDIRQIRRQCSFALGFDQHLTARKLSSNLSKLLNSAGLSQHLTKESRFRPSTGKFSKNTSIWRDSESNGMKSSFLRLAHIIPIHIERKVVETLHDEFIDNGTKFTLNDVRRIVINIGIQDQVDLRNIAIQWIELFVQKIGLMDSLATNEKQPSDPKPAQQLDHTYSLQGQQNTI